MMTLLPHLGGFYRDISMRKFAVLLAVLLAFGCGGDSSDGGPTEPQAPSFTGTYRLVSVIGIALPMTLIKRGHRSIPRHRS